MPDIVLDKDRNQQSMYGFDQSKQIAPLTFALLARDTSQEAVLVHTNVPVPLMERAALSHLGTRPRMMDLASANI